MERVTKVINRFDLGTLKGLVDECKLNVQTSSDKDYAGLSIYKYDRSVHRDGSWDNILLQLRGTVLDSSGNVVGRPFNKFFNTFELEDGYVDNLYKNHSYTIYEKMDGSMGSLFYWGGKWLVASSGSFSSEQAEWFRNKIKNYKHNMHILDESCTYVFELIYPKNKIVVDYGRDERLTLLAEIENKTGKISNLERTNYIAGALSFEMPMVYAKNEMDVIVREGVQNLEGFVIRFDNGEQVKIKLQEYVHLLRLCSGLTTKNIINEYVDGRVEYLRKIVEEEDLGFVEDLLNALDNYKKSVLLNHYKFIIRCIFLNDTTRKGIANFYRANVKYLNSINLTLVFALMRDDYTIIDVCLSKMIKNLKENDLSPFKIKSPLLDLKLKLIKLLLWKK